MCGLILPPTIQDEHFGFFRIPFVLQNGKFTFTCDKRRVVHGISICVIVISIMWITQMSGDVAHIGMYAGAPTTSHKSLGCAMRRVDGHLCLAAL